MNNILFIAIVFTASCSYIAPCKDDVIISSHLTNQITASMECDKEKVSNSVSSAVSDIDICEWSGKPKIKRYDSCMLAAIKVQNLYLYADGNPWNCRNLDFNKDNLQKSCQTLATVKRPLPRRKVNDRNVEKDSGFGVDVDGL